MSKLPPPTAELCNRTSDPCRIDGLMIASNVIQKNWIIQFVLEPYKICLIYQKPNCFMQLNPNTNSEQCNPITKKKTDPPLSKYTLCLGPRCMLLRAITTQKRTIRVCKYTFVKRPTSACCFGFAWKAVSFGLSLILNILIIVLCVK